MMTGTSSARVARPVARRICGRLALGSRGRSSGPAIGAPDWLLLLMLNLLFLAVGMFLDPLAALIILVPIFLPLAQAIGMDTIQFGVMIVLNLMIGLCTPPVGYLIYMTATMGDVHPTAVIRQSLPFIAVLLFVLGLVTYVPAITL